MTLDAVDPMAARVQCSATAKSTGRRCTRPAVQGATVCRYHGGSAPQTARKAARRLALGEALAELGRLGRPVEVDPAEAMLEMVYEAAGNVAVLRQLVQRLQVNDVDAGTGAIEGEIENRRGEPPVPGIGDIDRSELGVSIASRVDPGNWKAAPHVWVVMYDEERERLVRWSKACRDAGVDERRVRLAEDRGAQIAAVLTAAVGALFELLVSSGVDGGLLAELQRERVPGLLRTSITTTLTGEAAG
jgi:hypothetical protein